MTIAIGVSVGTAQLGGGETDRGMAGTDKVTFGGQLVLGCCGAVLFAANVAPTEEVVVLGADMSPFRLIGVTLISFCPGAVILHYSDFRGAVRWVRADTLAAVLRGTVVTYAVALGVSAAILWLFGRMDGVGPTLVVGQTVVLGLPAALGRLCREAPAPMKRALEKNALEWTVFGVGLVLVMATLGYLVREAFTTGSRPPELVVHLGAPRRVTEGYQVPVTVVNRGIASPKA